MQLGNRWGQTSSNKPDGRERMSQGPDYDSQRYTNRSIPVCFACGRRGHVKGAESCAAKGAACMKCGNIGHFARQCLKRPNTRQPSGLPPKRVRMVQGHSEEDKSDGYIFYAMGSNTFRFTVGGVEIPMTIDSGAAANIVSKEIWEDMKEAGVQVRKTFFFCLSEMGLI